jgi:8-oxo-dGTP diphosphatase
MMNRTPAGATECRPVIQVAVGVIQDAAGRILLAERPQGKPMAGYWEFPGGKIEADEDPRTALVRELHEELGIESGAPLPWLTRVFHYPHATAHLHLLRVLHWQGMPHGREAQRLSWQDPHAINVRPLLPANEAIIDALRLPPLYAITCATHYGVDAFMQRLQHALENGVRLLQVRERDMPPPQLAEFAAGVVQLAHHHGARVLMNGEAGLASQCGADGVHLQAAQLMACTQPPAANLWAASCHNREELLQAARLGADFAVLSPVLPTASHPEATGLGWPRFAKLCRDLPMPVFALGGMRRELLETAVQHNAQGIALLSGIW